MRKQISVLQVHSGVKLPSLRKMLILLGILGAFLMVMPVMGQGENAPPDYAIRNILSSVEGTMIVVSFDVVNEGSAAAIPATASIADRTGQALASEIVQPLSEFANSNVRLSFPAYIFQNQAGRTVRLTATVGIGEIEQDGSALIGNNTARVSVTIPENVGAMPTAPDGSAQTSGEEDAETILGIRMDSSTRLTIAAIVAGAGILLILIWAILLILRMLFSRPAVFPNWQPPYISTSYIDPNTLNGRRQLWQPHAQSDVLPMPCELGSFAARKVLIDTNGAKLAGWHVTGVRLNQYDSFGRVARSQVIGENGIVKRVDKAVKKSSTLNAEKAAKTMRPVANSLASAFTKKISRKNAGLPVALDIRLDGRHGEVRIIFELHECVGAGYKQVDQWEPEMVVTDKGIIHENFSYTLYGQRQDESKGAFRKRLSADINKTLGTMVQSLAAEAKPKNEPPPAPQAQPQAQPLGQPTIPQHAVTPQDTAETKAVSEQTPTNPPPPNGDA